MKPITKLHKWGNFNHKSLIQNKVGNLILLSEKLHFDDTSSWVSDVRSMGKDYKEGKRTGRVFTRF